MADEQTYLDPQDRDILRFSGLMGHHFTIITDCPEGRRRFGESDGLVCAKEWAECLKDQRAAIYQRTGNRWKWVNP